MRYDWPGNVRELQNLVERLFTITKKPVINLKDLSNIRIDNKDMTDMTLREAVSTFERQYIEDILNIVDGNRKKASEILGIHRNTLLTKMDGLNIQP